MNLLSGSLMGRSAYFLFPARLFRINIPKLCSEVKYLSCYQRRFRLRPERASKINGTGNETKPFIPRYYSNSRLKNFVEYVDDKLRAVKRANDRNRLALYLYRTIDTIDFNEFYQFLDLPDTFNSWFVVVELHAWMLMSQVMNSRKSGLQLRNAIVEVLWLDVEARLNNIGHVQKNILKSQLKELHGRLPVSLWAYDEGLLGSDTVLASAIWYKLFDKDCDDPVKLEVLVRYVRYQIQHLSILDIQDYSTAKEIKDIWIPFSNHVKAVSESEYKLV